MDAIDDLSDAIDVTRDRLTPFRKGTWFKLVLIVFFVSSLGFAGPTVPGGDPGAVPEEQPSELDQPQELENVPTDQLLFWGLVIGAIVLVLWLVYEFIAAVMEFVFLEALRSPEIHIRRYASANLGKGLSLYLFRLGLQLLVGVLIAAPALIVFVSMEAGFGALSSGLLLSYLLYALVLGLILVVALRFTTEFVTPVMLLEDRGVLGAWGRVWPTIRADWTEYGVYLLLVWILRFIIRIVAWMVIAVGSLLLLLPFGIVIVLLVATLGQAGILLAALVTVLAIIGLIALISTVYVPIETYFRYYALLLLGDTDGTFDLIPDRRTAVRGGRLADRTDRAQGTDAGGPGTDDGTVADRSSDGDTSTRWDDEPDDRDETDGQHGRDEDDGWR